MFGSKLKELKIAGSRMIELEGKLISERRGRELVRDKYYHLLRDISMLVEERRITINEIYLEEMESLRALNKSLIKEKLNITLENEVFKDKLTKIK